MRAWKRQTLKVSDKLSSSVTAVGVTGIVGSLLLPASAAGSFFAGSFVSMSSATCLPNTFALAAAAALAGVWQLGLTGVLLGGWGGKLGSAALLGVLSYKFTSNPTAFSVLKALVPRRKQNDVVPVKAYSKGMSTVNEKVKETESKVEKPAPKKGVGIPTQ